MLQRLLKLLGYERRPVTLHDLDPDPPAGALVGRGPTAVEIRGGNPLSYGEAEEELEARRKLSRIVAGIVAGAQDVEDKVGTMRLKRLQLIEMLADARNKIIKKEIEAAILLATKDDTVQAATLNSNTVLIRAQTANVIANADAADAAVDAEIRIQQSDERLARALGQSEAERETERRREHDRQVSGWALSLAQDASQKRYKLKLHGPYFVEDLYYAYVGTHFYYALLDGASEEEAIKIAAEKLFYRVRMFPETSDDEAKAFASKCHNAYQEWIRRKNAQEKEEEDAQALQVSRNNLEAARQQLMAAEKVEQIIHGSTNDGAHFDAKA